MRQIWSISAANGTYTHSFVTNTDGSVEDININAISYAFFSDTGWTTPTSAPVAGTMTWAGQQYYPNGVTTNIPVAFAVSPATTNVADFSVSGTQNGFTFAGKCFEFTVVIAGLSNNVQSIQIVIDRYTGGI